MNWNGKNVLITGGLGFIGSNLARHLVNEGAQVLIVDSLIPEYGGNLFNIEDIRRSVQVNISDVRDSYSFKHLIRGQDVLFNLAGQTSHMDSMTDPFTDLEINARAQLAILEACRQYNPGVRIVFASTRQIYGRPTYFPVNEQHPLRPVDVNGVHKLAGETYHLLYHEVYGLWTSVLRLTNTYGPRMRIRDARQTFLGVWIKQLLRGAPFEVWGGEQLRDFNYVEDVVSALCLCAIGEQANGRVFNLGGDEVLTLKALADLMIEVRGSGTYTIREFPEDRKRIDIGDYYADYTLIQQTVDWRPRVTLREGIQRTLNYYEECLDRYL